MVAEMALVVAAMPVPKAQAPYLACTVRLKRAFGGGGPQKKGGKNCVKTGLLLSIP